MNTAMVSTALDMLASKPASVSANKPADNTEAPRFSEVLSKQHASQQSSTEQPKTPSQPTTKEQETTDGGAGQVQAKNDTDTPASNNNSAPDDKTEVAQDPIALPLVENLITDTTIQADDQAQAKLSAQITDPRATVNVPVIADAQAAVNVTKTADASAVFASTKEIKNDGQALRFSAVALAETNQATPATQTALGKQIATVVATMVQPQAETRNTQQNANLDTKNKLSINKAALAAISTAQNGKAIPDTIKAKVNEFSSSMVESATLAQSRFAAANGADSVINTLSDAAPHQASLTTSATLPSASLLATLQGATTTPLSNPQWANDFGRQVVNFTQNSSNTMQMAELRLDPPELGPIRITINLSDNVANAAFFSPHAIVRQTVENALPHLQQLLAQAGISLGEASVSDQDQAGNQSANESKTSGNSNTRASSLSVGHTVVDPTTPAQSRNPDALVDTFA